MIDMDSGRRARPDTLVSVIIPAYNATATLAATLASVLGQTHRALQVFVVDDGSQDETAQLAASFAAQDSRLTVLRQANGGVARARNTALAKADGAYVAWVDADDLWHPTKIERQLAVFDAAEQPLAFVVTGYRLIDTGDRILPNRRTLTDISGFSLCRQIATNYCTAGGSCTMAPTHLAKSVNGHDPLLRDEGIQGAEDLLLQLRLAARGPAGCCHEALVGYRMHDSNMSLSHLRAAQSNLRAIELVAGENPAVPEWVLRMGRARVVGYAAYCLADGNIRQAFELVTLLARQQTPETMSMALRVAGLALRQALPDSGDPDPAVGTSFTKADPRAAPWRKHMLLSKHERARLDEFDARLAADHGAKSSQLLRAAGKEEATAQ